MQLAFCSNPRGGEDDRARAEPPGWNNCVAVVSAES